MRVAASPENPVAQAVALAAKAQDPVSSRDALASLESMDAETLLPIAVQLLLMETRRSQRRAIWVGGISAGLPLLLTLVLLAAGTKEELILGVVLTLLNPLGAGIFVALLLWFQVTSRWLLTRQAATRIATRLVDPGSVEELIHLNGLSQRRRDPQIAERVEATLTRLLGRFDPELHTLSESGRTRLLALAGKGSPDLTVAVLLTLASLKEPKAGALARKILETNTAPERVQMAARECLEKLGL